MSRLVPEGWEETPLGNVSNIYSGGTPSRSDASNYKGEIPWVKSGEVNQRTIRDTSETISERALTSSSTKWVEKGSVLVAMYGATAGKVAKLMIRATINQAIAAISAMPAKVSNDYLFHEIEFKSSKLLESVQGSGQPNLSGQLVKELKVSVPPIPEQKKIASILTSVDETIENTQKQIDKLQDLKKATMNELLTKGIGHAEFKDSELGQVPKSWEVKRLGDLCSKESPITYGVLKPGEYIVGGVPLLQVKDLLGGTVQISDLHRISNSLDKEYARSRIQCGDVLISLIGTVGRAALVPKISEVFNIHRNIGRIRVSNPYWVFLNLQSAAGVRQIKLASSGSSQSALNLSELKELMLPIPSAQEQQDISYAVQSLSNHITLKESGLRKIQSLKKSLMQDLLTGKVRVTVN